MNTNRTEFLIKNNYILAVSFIGENIFCQFNEVKWFYSYKSIDDEKKDQYYLMITYDGNKQESLLIPSYILRWYIFLDILKFCRENNLSYHIIKYFDIDFQEHDFDSIFKLLLPSEHVEKEKRLGEYISIALNKKQYNFNKEMSELNMKYTWNILKGLLV